MQRENFRSRLGFLLVSAGCAIGIGNVWRFPYITGQYGGGYFVLFYLICLVIMGIPVMTMELAVGRASRKSAVQAYQTLEKPGQKWHIHGWFCMLGCCLLMMYYTTVTGWMVDYFYKFLRGDFAAGMGTEEIGGVYSQMLSSPGEMTIFMVIVVVMGFLVCSFGVQKGLERITKVMMIALLALIVVLAVHSLLLPGAAEFITTAKEKGRQVRIYRWTSDSTAFANILRIERPKAVIAFEAAALTEMAELSRGEEAFPLLYGCGSTAGIAAALEKGRVTAIAAVNVFSAGYLAVEAAAKLARHESWTGAASVGFSVVRQETMYSSDNQKLLFPVT